MFKLIKYLILLTLILVISLPVVAWFTMVDNNPTVSYKTSLNDVELKRAKELLRKNDPRYQVNNSYQHLTIQQKDADLAANYFLQNQKIKAHAKIRFYDNASYMAGSLQLPEPLSNKYLNMSLTLYQRGPVDFSVTSIKLGAIELNEAISNIIAQKLYAILSKEQPVVVQMLASIQSIKLNQKNVDVAYQFNKRVFAEIKQQGTEYLISSSLKIRLAEYQKVLSEITRNNEVYSPSLSYLLPNMFIVAAERSAANYAPVAENRAVLLTLGTYINGRNINTYIDNDTNDHIRYISYTLNNRNDLARHCLVSAAITAMADTNLANIIGLQKEIDDSKGGSGFSFADLAADRTGVQMAKLLLDENTAAAMQRRMIDINTESDFMMDIQTLPEGLQQIDFKALYKNTESKEYRQAVNAIDKTIYQQRVFQGMQN